MEQRRMMYRGGLSAGGKPTCRHSRTSPSVRSYLVPLRCDRDVQPLPSPLRASYNIESLSLDMLPGSSAGCRGGRGGGGVEP